MRFPLVLISEVSKKRNVVILCGLVVVSLFKDNVVCRELVVEFPLPGHLLHSLQSQLYCTALPGLGLIITSGTALTSSDNKKRAPGQLFKLSLMLRHALQCKLYSKSTRPPSNAGRDNDTITTPSDRNDMLMSLAS